jgi:hypothetical protein
VKGSAYSLQIPFSSQKAEILTEALYLNFSANGNFLPLNFGFSKVSSLFSSFFYQLSDVFSCFRMPETPETIKHFSFITY